MSRRRASEIAHGPRLSGTRASVMAPGLRLAHLRLPQCELDWQRAPNRRVHGEEGSGTGAESLPQRKVSGFVRQTLRLLAVLGVIGTATALDAGRSAAWVQAPQSIFGRGASFASRTRLPVLLRDKCRIWGGAKDGMAAKSWKQHRRVQQEGAWHRSVKLQAGGGADDYTGENVGEMQVFDVNMDGTHQARLVWNAEKDRYVPQRISKGSNTILTIVQNEFMSHKTEREPGIKGIISLISRQLHVLLMPRGVSKDYYAYTLWRVAQRIVSSTVSVFGTQSLLLALGVKTTKFGAAAASSWVFANALAKFGKTGFAAIWSKGFDTDAKRWRFRAAVMWMVSGALEILTLAFQQDYPRSFAWLVLFSVTFKQTSILTAAATRGTFYSQFAQRENLGDITAKGDAQVAMADLFGLLVGVHLARAAGTNALFVWGSFVLLSTIDFLCILKSLDMIIFKFLNMERLSILAHHYVVDNVIKTPEEVAPLEPITSRPEHANSNGFLLAGNFRDTLKGYWAGTFRKLSTIPLTPTELRALTNLFKDREYMILNHRQKQPCIVLRQSAEAEVVVEALLALEYFKKALDEMDLEKRIAVTQDNISALPLITAARDFATVNIEKVVQEIGKAGWNIQRNGQPSLMLGYIRHRAMWGSVDSEKSEESEKAR